MITDKELEIIAASPLPDWDQELIVYAIEGALKRWEDDKTKRIIDVERWVEHPFRGKIDLILESNNQITLADWKVTRGKLDARWRLRQTRSWQLKLYAALMRPIIKEEYPVIGEYRGVLLSERPKFECVRFEITEADATLAEELVKQATVERDALSRFGREPWPRNPARCRMFGDRFPCDFEGRCWRGEGEPVRLATDEFSPFSFTSLSDFFQCNELYRLKMLLTQDEPPEATVPGSVFHDVIASILKRRMG